MITGMWSLHSCDPHAPDRSWPSAEHWSFDYRTRAWCSIKSASAVGDAVPRNRFYVPTHPRVVEALRHLHRLSDLAGNPKTKGGQRWIDSSAKGLDLFEEMIPRLIRDDVTNLRDGRFAGKLGDRTMIMFSAPCDPAWIIAPATARNIACEVLPGS